MFKDKELIIFDLDGTLIDSAPSLANAILFMLKELNLEPLDRELIKTFVGNGADILVKRSLARDKDYTKVKIDQELFNKAKELFFNYYANNLTQDTLLYPNVKETLKFLKEKGYTLALATNKPYRFIETLLEHFDIYDLFTIYLGGDSVENKKPNPQMLLEILNRLNKPPQKAVMVGDSSNDILAAKRANIDSIALTYGYNQGVNLKELNPTIICSDFSELKELF